MKQSIAIAVLILALGADSVSAFPPGRSAHRLRTQAANKKANQNSRPLSGGSITSPSGAASGGTITSPARKASHKKRHPKPRRHKVSARSIVAGPPRAANSRPVEPARAIPGPWPSCDRLVRLADIGRGKAVIFSPDFARPGNREFYRRLGFLYIEDASWKRALNQVIARNYWHPDDRIETLILEAHGANGSGLKLQTGSSRPAARSYISIASLQEKLEGLGVRLCVIGACNAGRLLRPEIYKALKAQPRERLFLPATLGIFNASQKYDPTQSSIVIARRAESHIEATSDGDTSEFSALTRTVLGLINEHAPRQLQFAVSNLLIQMLVGDPSLKLTASGYSVEKSRKRFSEAESEDLFRRFLSYVNNVALREWQIAHGANNAASVTRAIDRGSNVSLTASSHARKRSRRRVID